MRASSSWRPLLTGARAETARAIIDDIATSVRQDAMTSAGNPEIRRGGNHPWPALLPAYRWADDQAREDDATYVGEALEQLATTTVDYGDAIRLYNGVGSLTWMHAHLTNELFEADEEAPPDGPDEQDASALILSRLREVPPGDYDLIGGLVGIGVIGLELVHAPERTQIVTEVLAALKARSEPDELGGRRLLTSPDLLPAWQRARAPEGYYNLGVAHGMPGIVALAAESFAQGIAPELSRSLAQEFCDWLLRIRVADGSPGFGGWIEKGAQNVSSNQLAWCYGGLGVSATIMRAAQAFAREDWRQQAIEIARACATVAEAAAPLRDQGLCHGAAGNAHIFNRLYQASGDERLRQTALAYYDATLDAYRPGTGIGGYQAWGSVGGFDRNSLDLGSQGYIDDVSLLTGSSGIGLALLAAVSHVEPNWDRALLLNVAPLATSP